MQPRTHIEVTNVVQGQVARDEVKFLRIRQVLKLFFFLQQQLNGVDVGKPVFLSVESLRVRKIPFVRCHLHGHQQVGADFNHAFADVDSEEVLDVGGELFRQ